MIIIYLYSNIIKINKYILIKIKKVNYLSKSIIIILSVLIFWFLVFSTFFINDSNKLENMDIFVTPIWKYEIIIDNDKFNLTKIENNFNWKVLLDKITKTSKILSLDWDYNNTNSWKIIEIEIKKWIYLFDIKEINNNISIISNWFKINNIWIWKFFINLTDQNKVLIYSMDSVLDFSLIQNNNDLITNINLYPNVYLLLNIDKIEKSLASSLKNSDALKVSKILNLNYYNDKIYNNDWTPKDYIINLFTIKNQEYTDFVNTSLLYIYYDYVKNINYKLKTLQVWIIPEYLSKYFKAFKNNEKKEIYYKNIILKKIILLVNENNKNNKIIDEIIDDLKTLNSIKNSENNNIENIIYYYYLSSFKNIFNNNLVVNENFWTLISKLQNTKYETKKSDLSLKNLYYKSNFLTNKSIFDNINSFIEQYLKDYNLSKNNTDYFLAYIWNLTKSSKSDDSNLNTENVIISLWKYIDILINYWDISDSSNIKTTIYNITEILNNVYLNILTNYFEPNRDKNELLTRNNNKILEKNLDNFIKSIQDLSTYIDLNIKKVTKDDNTLKLIKEYQDTLLSYDEILLALKDEDQYNKKYNKSYNIFEQGSIYKDNQVNLIDSRNKIINYLLLFNWVNLSWIEINSKNKFYCDYPLEENYNENLETYCFEIKNLILTNENYTSIKLNFLFFPYENNKINNIVINKNWEIKKYSRTYDLNNLEKEFEEKQKNLSEKEEKEKYSFKNFFILTFNDTVIESIRGPKDEDEIPDFILNEDKAIKTFKRNKLLWDKWDFAILNWYLDIKYNELKVTQDNLQNFNIEIIDSILTDNINTWIKEENYKAEFSSKYLFSPEHSFQDIKLKFLDTKNNVISNEKKYLLWEQIINLNWNTHITKIKDTIKKLLVNLWDIKTVIDNIKYVSYTNNINIEYLYSEDIIKFDFVLNQKNVNIYLQYWKIIEIYYNWNSIIKETINIGELNKILNNL